MLKNILTKLFKKQADVSEENITEKPLEKPITDPLSTIQIDNKVHDDSWLDKYKTVLNSVKGYAVKHALDSKLDYDSSFLQYGDSYNSLLRKYTFIPFAELALLSQVPLIYNACDTYAKEMMRAGYEFHAIVSTNDDEKIIQLLKDEYRKYDIDKIMYKMYSNNFKLGGSQLYTKFKNDELRLDKELKLDKDGIAPDTLEWFHAIEPTWCYPTLVNYENPLAKDFYSPTIYNVMGVVMHASRLHKMVYDDVPDLIRPIYLHYGLSLTQKIVHSIEDFIDIKDIIKEIISRFNLTIMKVDMSKYAQNQSMLKQKMTNFNKIRSNFGSFIIDKNSEDLQQITLALAGLDDLLSRFIEIISMNIQIPQTKWLGISPRGMTANDESSHRNWYDLIMGLLENMGKPAHDRIIKTILLNKGIDSHNYTVKFNKLHETNKLEDAQIRKIESDIAIAAIQAGVITPADYAQILQAGKDEKYKNIIIPKNKGMTDTKQDNQLERQNQKEFE